MAERTTVSTTVTRVVHVAKPAGVTRENGPHLSDLRDFVAACEELPGHAIVRINQGQLTESGRRDVTIEINYRHPDPEPPVEP